MDTPFNKFLSKFEESFKNKENIINDVLAKHTATWRKLP